MWKIKNSADNCKEDEYCQQMPSGLSLKIRNFRLIIELCRQMDLSFPRMEKL